MQRIKKLTAIMLSILTVSSVCVFGSVSAGATGTGARLAEWALNAYYSGWAMFTAVQPRVRLIAPDLFIHTAAVRE